MTFPDTLITTYLKVETKPEALQEPLPPANTSIQQMTYSDVAYYRFLYREVGEMWRWRDRLLLDDETLREMLTEPKRPVYVLYKHGVPAGYVELHHLLDAVEIAYFGLRPAFFGQGLGKYLLNYGLYQAWIIAEDIQRVWLHTCNLDSPRALPNYQARGFVIYDVKEEPMPARFE